MRMTASSVLGNFHGFCNIARRYSLHCMAIDSTPSRTWDPVYYWQGGVKNLERYRAGGHHPIELGDEFSHGRYRVIHKLGYGSFSTVWLARDHRENRYVSLKVIIAAASGQSLDAKVRHRLRLCNLDHPGRRFVLSSLDEFWIDGPNGRHKCLVIAFTVFF